jgi:hypothetical protein
MNLRDFEKRLLKHRPVSPRGSYPAEIFPVIERARAQGIPAKVIAAELLKEPEMQGRTLGAIYRRIQRHFTRTQAQTLDA